MFFFKIGPWFSNISSAPTEPILTNKGYLWWLSDIQKSDRKNWINASGEFHKDYNEPLFVEIGSVSAEETLENQGPILKKHVNDVIWSQIGVNRGQNPKIGFSEVEVRKSHQNRSSGSIELMLLDRTEIWFYKSFAFQNSAKCKTFNDSHPDLMSRRK